MKAKNKISKVLSVAVLLTNINSSLFAKDIFAEQNEYKEEMLNIETKRDLEKSAQKAVKSGEVDTWITGLANMPVGVDSFGSAVVDGKIYCIGGIEDDDGYTGKLQVYDPITNTWETKSPMLTPRCLMGVAVVERKIYCIGGWDGKALGVIEVYDVDSDTWEFKGNMPDATEGFGVSVKDSKIYCIGGGTNSASKTNAVQVYDVKANRWETKANMPTSRRHFLSVQIDNEVYCIGGNDLMQNSYNVVEVYDIDTDTWNTSKTPMPTPRGGLKGVVVNNSEIYCIGGRNGNIFTDKVEVYNVKSDSWETKTPMPTGRSAFISEMLNNKIYCIGGYGGGTTAFDMVEAYIVSPPLKSSSNIDVYIKPQSILSVSLNLNSVTFEEFNGVDNMEMLGALELSVDSNLPYDINAVLESEITNSEGTKTMDKSIFGIKASTDSIYKSFSNVGEKIVLFNNINPSMSQTHLVDMRLNGGIPYETDVYKTVVKFEVAQK